MKLVGIVNRTRESVLGSRVGVADRWWLRARGFLRRPQPAEGEGLLLNPCRAVHMVGMSFPLDIVFVDRKGRVLALYRGLGPGRRSKWHGSARYALEVPPGTIEATGTTVGDLVAWVPAESDDAGLHAGPAGGGAADANLDAAAELEATETPRGTR